MVKAQLLDSDDNHNAQTSDTALLRRELQQGGTLSIMNRMRTKPLIPPLSGRWARIGLILMLSAGALVSAQAQEGGGSNPLTSVRWGEAVHTRTWSIYAEGGLSWATDVWYQNLDAKRSYNQSPAVGGGVDFTIRPWVRVGAEYLWSRYRREQRFSNPDMRTMPVKVYGNYVMNFHNAKLGVQFNFMELWRARRAQWLNVWVGTGMGYSFIKGNEYGIFFNNTMTQNGQTTPVGNAATVDDESGLTLTGNVRTTNRHEKFNKLYIPTTLHVEADVSRRFTVGLKGEMDWLLSRGGIAPKNYVFALATVRYNFVASRAKVQQGYYEGELSLLNDRVNALQKEAAESRERADREATERQRAEQKNADLQQRLSEYESSMNAQSPAVQISHYVQFAHNCAGISRDELAHLRYFASYMRGHQLSIIAEASTPGPTGYNQKLSERRLKRVVKVLLKEGFAKEDLHPQVAIGEQDGKPDAEGRRVTIKLVK